MTARRIGIRREDRSRYERRAPLTPGHVLVVPVEEVDHWIDLDADLAAHLMLVAREVGRAQMQAFTPRRIGVIIAGLEKRHTISPADKALFDPERPRMRLQGGFPLLCGAPSSNAPGSVVPPRAP